MHAIDPNVEDVEQIHVQEMHKFSMPNNKNP